MTGLDVVFVALIGLNCRQSGWPKRSSVWFSVACVRFAELSRISPTDGRPGRLKRRSSSDAARSRLVRCSCSRPADFKLPAFSLLLLLLLLLLLSWSSSNRSERSLVSWSVAAVAFWGERRRDMSERSSDISRRRSGMGRERTSASTAAVVFKRPASPNRDVSGVVAVLFPSKK